jgi:hypothetical protein
MRTAKQNIPPSGISRQEWNRKQFISWLAEPLMNRLVSGDIQRWTALTRTFIQLLDEKHILLQFNDPEMSSLIAKRGWDGSVQPQPNSDFLMVVDSNIGFNKTNALMQTTHDYTVNLTNLIQPVGNLAITLTNNSQVNSGTGTECIQAGGDFRKLPLDQRNYLINDCYWTYLRIYTPSNSQLISSTPQEIPQKWPLREQIIPARTDILAENIPGVHSFGTLLVVPRGKTHQTNFSYRLPAMVVTNGSDGDKFKYNLKIQKQPGTLAVPLTFHLILSPGMIVSDAPNGLIQNQQAQNEWILKIDLHRDTLIEISVRTIEQ